MKYVILVLLAVGAFVAYLSKHIFRWVKKEDPTPKQNVNIKLIGLAFVLIAVVMTFVFLR